MRTAAWILTILLFEAAGAWYGYEHGYRSGFRHGVETTISEVERLVAERTR